MIKTKIRKELKNEKFIIFYFSFYNIIRIFKNLCSEVILKCEEMEKNIDSLSKEENFEKAMDIYNLIEDKGKLAAIYVNHLDYDVMLNEALKLTVYIERDDYGESDASLHLLKSSTEHMKELQVPNIENIF